MNPVERIRGILKILGFTPKKLSIAAGITKSKANTILNGKVNRMSYSSFMAVVPIITNITSDALFNGADVYMNGGNEK